MDSREATFRQWLDAYQGLMCKISRTFARNREDQEDLLQEIFFQVWCSIGAFRGQSQVSTWIYKVALNTAMSWQRRDGRGSRQGRFVARAGPTVESVASPEPDAGDVEKQALLQELYKAVYSLPKVDCALTLLYLNGLKYSEMAEILGMSESNVGVRLSRVRQYLAANLGGSVDGSR